MPDFTILSFDQKGLKELVLKLINQIFTKFVENRLGLEKPTPSAAVYQPFSGRVRGLGRGGIRWYAVA